MKHHSMQSNFFVLKALSVELERLLPGAMVQSCFSQVKEELLIQFRLTNNTLFFIQAHLQPAFTSLNFPEHFHRAKRNTVDLFPEMIGRKVVLVSTAPFDRILKIELDRDFQLYFKMFGSKSNVFLFAGGAMLRMFRNQLKGEVNFNPAMHLQQMPDLSYESFSSVDFQINKLLPVASREVEAFLVEKGFETANEDERRNLWNGCISLLTQPNFYIGIKDDQVILTLFPIEGVNTIYKSVLDALRFFFKFYHSHTHYKNLLNSVSKVLYKKLEATNHFLERSRQQLSNLIDDRPKEQWADILMANLHDIPAGAREVTLHDFYRNTDITLKIKDGLSPQEQAERWYKKAKNKKQEIDQLKSGIESREQIKSEILASLSVIENETTLSELLSLQKQWIKSMTSQDEDQSAFKEELFLGYTILIGRNAKNNELLLLQAHKDDLWLHARDVSGSHVLIKKVPGRSEFPKQVIERAAELAAWNSKRKSDSLCPVMVTSRKYVRKIKGGAPGLVRVERESVIMVTPRN